MLRRRGAGGRFDGRIACTRANAAIVRAMRRVRRVAATMGRSMMAFDCSSSAVREYYHKNARASISLVTLIGTEI